MWHCLWLTFVVAASCPPNDLVNVHVQFDDSELHADLQNRLTESQQVDALNDSIVASLQERLPLWQLQQGDEFPRLYVSLWTDGGSKETFSVTAEIYVQADSQALEVPIAEFELCTPGALAPIWWDGEQLRTKLASGMDRGLRKHNQKCLDTFRTVPLASGFVTVHQPNMAAVPLEWSEVVDYWSQSLFRFTTADGQRVIWSKGLGQPLTVESVDYLVVQHRTQKQGDGAEEDWNGDPADFLIGKIYVDKLVSPNDAGLAQ